MAKNGKKNGGKGGGEPFLKTETKHGIWAVVFFVLGLFFLMSGFDMAGVAGTFFYDKLYYLNISF